MKALRIAMMAFAALLMLLSAYYMLDVLTTSEWQKCDRPIHRQLIYKHDDSTDRMAA